MYTYKGVNIIVKTDGTCDTVRVRVRAKVNNSPITKCTQYKYDEYEESNRAIPQYKITSRVLTTTLALPTSLLYYPPSPTKMLKISNRARFVTCSLLLPLIATSEARKGNQNHSPHATLCGEFEESVELPGSTCKAVLCGVGQRVKKIGPAAFHVGWVGVAMMQYSKK